MYLQCWQSTEIDIKLFKYLYHIMYWVFTICCASHLPELGLSFFASSLFFYGADAICFHPVGILLLGSRSGVIFSARKL